MIGPLLKREIEHTFNIVPSKCTAEELVFVCPEAACGDASGNRALNLRTGKTFCWRCNKGAHNKGSFLAWARANGYTFTADGGSSDMPLDQMLYETEEQVSAVPVLQEVDLPEGFTPIASTRRSVYTRLITEMAERKNLHYEDFEAAGVGYTMDSQIWEPFAIFPVTEYGMTVYYQGRTYIDVPGESTKRFPSRASVKWGASYWVYNIDEVRAKNAEIVVIVESILNVLSLKRKFKQLGWEKIVPVCVFKHHISQVQVLKLLRCKSVQEFCLLFDHDAIDATWRMVGALNEKVAVTVAEMPMKNGNKKLDPNDDVDEAVRAIRNRTLYTSASAVANLVKNDVGLADKRVDISGSRIQKHRS